MRPTSNLERKLADAFFGETDVQREIVRHIFGAEQGTGIDNSDAEDGERGVRFSDDSIVFITTDGEVY